MTYPPVCVVRVVEPATPAVVRVPTPAVPAVVRVVEPGPWGPAGPPGADRTSVINTIAAVTLGGHRVVRGTADGVLPCSASDVATLGQALGITLGAASAGQYVALQASGEIEEPSWSWAPGRVWLGEAGGLTQSPPSSGYLQQIGVSNGPTKLIVLLGLPLLLASTET